MYKAVRWKFMMLQVELLGQQAYIYIYKVYFFERAAEYTSNMSLCRG